LITVFEADRGAVSLIPSILVGVTLGSGKRWHCFPELYVPEGFVPECLSQKAEDFRRIFRD
jgi:hypothetical protein